MQNKNLLFIGVILLLINTATAIPLWGVAGHQLVASVATAFLNSSAASQTSSILSGQSLSDIANWADQVKTEPAYAWSYNLHFINTPSWACNYIPSRDCADGNCVGGAIYNYSSRLLTQTDPQQIQEALKFLTHFVGDIHQPLHCGFTDDKGGNTIEGTFNGYKDNLHSIWDKWIIQERIDNDFNGDQSQYLNYLVQQLQGPWAANISTWTACANSSALACPDEWGTVSAGLACQYAYTDSNGNQIQSGFDLGIDYYNFTSPIVDLQLAVAGLRLAATLNKIYPSS